MEEDAVMEELDEAWHGRWMPPRRQRGSRGGAVEELRPERRHG
jgi:hypothetical protein